MLAGIDTLPVNGRHLDSCRALVTFILYDVDLNSKKKKKMIKLESLLNFLAN